MVRLNIEKACCGDKKVMLYTVVGVMIPRPNLLFDLTLP